MKLANRHGVLRLGRYLYLKNDFAEVYHQPWSDVMLLVPWHEELPRERRRRDLARMKAKARRTFKATGSRFMTGLDREDWLTACEKLANHLAHCGKPCCNRRRFYEGPTIQEKRYAARYADLVPR